MSFSVTAAEYVPPQLRGVANGTVGAAPSAANGSSMSPTNHSNGDKRSGPPTPSGSGSLSARGGVLGGPRPGMASLKQTVCTPFFQSGSCPTGNTCVYAHHIDELEPQVIAQLLEVAGEKALPVHFAQRRSDGMNIKSKPFIPRSNSNNVSNGGDDSSFVNNAMNGGSLNVSATDEGNGTGSHRQQQQQHRRAGHIPNFLHSEIRVTLPQRCFFPHAVRGTYYDHLNVKPHCTTDDVNGAYHKWRYNGYKQAKAIDSVKADAMDRLVVEAKLVLGNPTMRAEYDRMLPAEYLSEGQLRVGGLTANGNITSSSAAVSSVAAPSSGTIPSLALHVPDNTSIWTTSE